MFPSPQAHHTPFIPDQSDRLDDLRAELARSQDLTQSAQIQARIEHAEDAERRRERAEAARDRERAAKVVEGERRQAAAKARWQREHGQLRSEVSVSAEAAKRFVMARLVAEASIELAFQEIKAKGLHPIHSTAMLGAYVDELRASQPELAPHLAKVELPSFAPNIADLDRELPVYQPPPPPAPSWPAPDPAYVQAAREALESIHAQGASATWIQVDGRIAPMSSDVYGSGHRREHVQRVVERGASLAWAPMPGRVVPPALSEGSWQPLADGSGWVFEPATALEKGSK